MGLLGRRAKGPLERLAALHARFLSAQRGGTVAPGEALTELQAHAPLLDDSTLRQPRVVLLAADFSKVVTSTVVFLREIGLDMRLVRFQAYRTEAGLIITVSQHYPVPEVEEFTLMPELVEQREERADRQQRQRETSAVRRLIAANAVPRVPAFGSTRPGGLGRKRAPLSSSGPRLIRDALKQPGRRA